MMESMIPFALLFAALAPDEGLADQIARCGVDRAQFEVRYEEAIEEETAIISTADSALTSD